TIVVFDKSDSGRFFAIKLSGSLFFSSFHRTFDVTISVNIRTFPVVYHNHLVEEKSWMHEVLPMIQLHLILPSLPSPPTLPDKRLLQTLLRSPHPQRK